MNPIPKFAQSSIDPTQVSLTIISLGKAVVGVLTTFAILKGVDPLIVTSNVQTITEAATNIVAQYVAIVPAVFAAYQSAQLVWGVLRKIAVRIFAKATITPSAAADNVAIVPPTDTTATV